jgi:hypothetical protein
MIDDLSPESQNEAIDKYLKALQRYTESLTTVHKLLLDRLSQLRPYLPDCTGSRLISKVKLGRAPLVL